MRSTGQLGAEYTIPVTIPLADREPSLGLLLHEDSSKSVAVAVNKRGHGIPIRCGDYLTRLRGGWADPGGDAYQR